MPFQVGNQLGVGNDYSRKHGHAWPVPSREYNSWRGMIKRCYQRNHDSFMYYGGRGITVCKRWRNSFENFLVDMGKRPEGKTLDRKNSNGNYIPSNCRWATRSVQQLNRRSWSWSHRG